jgi:hypothetical protein
MRLQHNLYVLDKITYGPDDISVNDGETVDIPINGREEGFITNVTIKKPELQLTARGLTEEDLRGLQQIRIENIRSLIHNRPLGVDIDLGSFTIYGAYLVDYAITAPQVLEGVTVYNQITLTYRSKYFQ